MIKGVLFDIDDTLVDTKGAFAHGLSAICDRFLAHLSQEQREEVLDLWRQDPNGHYRAYTRGEISARRQRMDRANELHATFGGQVLDEAGFDAWDEVFQAGFTAYVGDELDIDARGAAAVGLTGIWLDRPGTRRGGIHLEDVSVAAGEDVRVIASLDQVAQVLGLTVEV